MADEQTRMEYDVDYTDVVAAEKALKKLSEAADQAADSSKKAEKSTADFGRTALEGSRILQDFAQGGIGGIVNNAEGLVRAIGGSAGMAGAATGLLVAILALKDPVKNFITALVEGANDVPKTTDALGAMNAELGTAKKRLDDLAGQQSLTNSELAEYNSLMTSTSRLEKEVNEERARRNALEAARKSEGQNPEAAKAAQAAITAGGGIDKLIEALAPEFTNAARPDAEAGVRALRERLARGLNANRNSIKDQEALEGVYRPQIAAAQAAAAAEANRVGTGRAADLLLRARQGDTAAIDELANRLPAGGFNNATAAGLASAKETEAARQRSAEDAKRNAEEVARRQDAADLREAAAMDATTERTPEQKAARSAQIRAQRAAEAESQRLADEEARAMGRVGREAPGHGAAINAVNALKSANAEQQAAYAELAANVNKLMADQAAQAQWWARQRQEQQITRTRMSRVRPGQAQGEQGVDPWASTDIPPDALEILWEREQRTYSRQMPAAPGLLDYGNW